MSRRRSPTPGPKDFIAFRGPMTLKITPQTRRGWRAMAMWMLALLLPLAPYTLLAVAVDDTPGEHWAPVAIAPLLIVEAALIWAMTRWMLARAEIISLNDFRQWREERERTNRNRRTS